MFREFMDRVQGLNNHLEITRKYSKTKGTLDCISLKVHDFTLFRVIKLVKILSCWDCGQQLLNCEEEWLARLRWGIKRLAP